jgi:lysozyme family protein
MASDAFARALAFVLGFEGGYADHPADRGGPTMRGITQKRYDAYRHALGWAPLPVKDIRDDEVSGIYRTGYWLDARCDVLDAMGMHRLALLHFDSAVQHGPSRAIVLLQRALASVEPDGAFGPQTLNACRAAFAIPGGEDELIDGYLLRRRVYYERIVANDPTQRVFLRGWLRRLEAVRAEVVR